MRWMGGTKRLPSADTREVRAVGSGPRQSGARAGVCLMFLLGAPSVAFAAPPVPSSDGDTTSAEPPTPPVAPPASAPAAAPAAPSASGEAEQAKESDPNDTPSPEVREIVGPAGDLSARDRRRLAGDDRRRRRSAWLVDRRALPSLRVAVGPAAPIAPARPAAVAFDLDAGLWIVPKPRARASFTLRPSLGYALVAERQDPRHAAAVGVGLGVGSPIGTVSWVPSVLVGAVDRAPMVAVRHGLEIALGYGIVSVQARHEIIPRGSAVEQALAVSFGFDFVAIAWLASASSQ